jgi:hypothetical protein
MKFTSLIATLLFASASFANGYVKTEADKFEIALADKGINFIADRRGATDVKKVIVFEETDPRAICEMADGFEVEPELVKNVTTGVTAYCGIPAI